MSGLNEIGTIAAIGTSPNKILSLFIMEGFLLGLLGTLIGVVISLGSILCHECVPDQF